MKKTLHESPISVIRLQDKKTCYKIYKEDKDDRKISKEYCVCHCLRNIGADVIYNLKLDIKSHKLFMPFMKHGDVYNNIFKFGDNDIDFIFKQVVLTIDKVHNSGVSHRDIKTENILIDDNYKVILSDFGECDIIKLPWEENTRLLNNVKGTTPYIAPEEFYSKEFCGIKVDIWALGILFYVMKTNEFPWEIANEYDKKFTRYIDKPSCHFNEFPGIIKKMLSINPRQRVTTKEIIEDKWFKNIKNVDLKFCFYN